LLLKKKHCYDIHERTIKSSTDNIVSLYWDRKGSIAASSPAAYLLRAQALHQRHHHYLSLEDYLIRNLNNAVMGFWTIQKGLIRQFFTHNTYKLL
jgi:hypothetical protein